MDLINLLEQKILVTGGAGFLGSRLVVALQARGVAPGAIIVPRSKDCDLRERNNCQRLTAGVDIVIHAAGNVGGIGKNLRLPGTLFYDNAVMGIELMEAARQNGVQKFVCLSTICAYPKYTPVPFKEEDLWAGYPEETNAAYGLAKKMLLVQAQSYRQQFGFNAIYLLPVNMYGPGDNFNPESSHVIPATIRKMVEAKENGQPAVTLWGDGTPTREFIYVDDVVEAVVLSTERYNGAEPVNIGSGQEIAIADLAQLIASLVGFTGEIKWDTSKPNGQPRRLLDVTRAWSEFNFSARTPFREGLRRTIDWWLAHRS